MVRESYFFAILGRSIRGMVNRWFSMKYISRLKWKSRNTRNLQPTKYKRFTVSCLPTSGHGKMGITTHYSYYFCSHEKYLCWGRQNLGCVALAVWIWLRSPSDLLYRLNCHVLWEICSLLDSGLLATAIKVSKSRHNNLTIELHVLI